MPIHYFVAKVVQASCIIAILINLFLIFVVSKFSKTLVTFKYFLIYFALLEICFALEVFFTTPVFHAIEHRLVVFTYGRLLSNSSYGIFAAGLYCMFFEMWIVFVAVMFLYRYLALCKLQWHYKFKRSRIIKFAVVVVYLCHVAYAFTCGVIMCSQARISKQHESNILEMFEMGEVNNLQYVGAIIFNADNSVSGVGVVSVANHFILCGFSTVTIIFCGRKMWKAIEGMSKNCINYKKNKEILHTLSLQALIPLILYLLPTITILMYTLIDSESSVGFFVPFMSLLWTIPKILDPLCAILIIKEYRDGARKLLGLPFRRHSVASFTTLSHIDSHKWQFPQS